MPESEKQITSYNPSENGFILVDKIDKPEVLNEILKVKAASVNNMLFSDIDINSPIIQAKIKKDEDTVKHIMSNRVNLDEIKKIVEVYEDTENLPSKEDNNLLKKYFGRNFILAEEFNNKYISKVQRYGQVLDKKNNPNINTNKDYLSYGVFMPSYIKELVSYRQEVGTSHQHQSLLVGALTTDTIAEYIGAVNYVFKNSKASVIDIDKGSVSEAPNFQVENGTKTSFKNNTFDTIHTNFLLHQLKGNRGDKNNRVNDLFSEFYRISKTQGKIIMVEGDLEKVLKVESSPLMKIKIHSYLQEVGFKNIQIKNARYFAKNSDLIRFTRSSAGNQDVIDSKRNYIDKEIFVITATK